MESQLFTSIASIATAIIGVAILSVLVSQKSNTANVITAGGNAFSNALGVAEGPITGFTPSSSGVFNLPTASGGFSF